MTSLQPRKLRTIAHRDADASELVGAEGAKGIVLSLSVSRPASVGVDGAEAEDEVVDVVLTQSDVARTLATLRGLVGSLSRISGGEN
jgi:hypothetical protein